MHIEVGGQEKEARDVDLFVGVIYCFFGWGVSGNSAEYTTPCCQYPARI